jgi:hypothetical protein
MGEARAKKLRALTEKLLGEKPPLTAVVTVLPAGCYVDEALANWLDLVPPNTRFSPEVRDHIYRAAGVTHHADDIVAPVYPSPQTWAERIRKRL